MEEIKISELEEKDYKCKIIFNGKKVIYNNKENKILKNKNKDLEFFDLIFDYSYKEASRVIKSIKRFLVNEKYYFTVSDEGLIYNDNDFLTIKSKNLINNFSFTCNKDIIQKHYDDNLVKSIIIDDKFIIKKDTIKSVDYTLFDIVTSDIIHKIDDRTIINIFFNNDENIRKIYMINNLFLSYYNKTKIDFSGLVFPKFDNSFVTDVFVRDILDTDKNMNKLYQLFLLIFFKKCKIKFFNDNLKNKYNYIIDNINKLSLEENFLNLEPRYVN